MSVVLISGSCGLVGSEASFFFHDKGFDIVGIDNNFRQNFFGKDGDTNWIKKKLNKLKNYKHYNIDIRNNFQLDKIFKKYKKNIKLIIHAAAQPSHDWAKNNLDVDFKINALGTLNILNFAKKYSPNTTFIHLSTNKVYGDNPNKLIFDEKKTRYDVKKTNIFYKGIPENFNLDQCTHSFFGTSKLYADILAQEFGKNYNLKTGIFRAGCIAGPNHSGAGLHGFLSYLVKISLRKKKYNIIGYNGKQVRDNLHSFDLVSCFWNFFKKPKFGEVYNIGGGRFSNCSVLEALNYVEERAKLKIQKKFFKTPRVGDHIWYISDCSKFKKHFPNWRQKYSYKKIIDEIIELDQSND